MVKKMAAAATSPVNLMLVCYCSEHGRHAFVTGGNEDVSVSPADVASKSTIGTAACKLYLRDMVRMPKDKPLVLSETMMNCGKHGQHSLDAFNG